MSQITGSEILARCLKLEHVDHIFFLMGGPMLEVEAACIKNGIRMIDVRHEQAAAMMAIAYSRLLQVPSVCMAASGPGVTNLVTGLANALIDGAPVIAFGGASPISQFGRQVFQEIDQMQIMAGCTKYQDRLYNLKRIPQQVNAAFQRAIVGKPGPVYIDCPGDILHQSIDENLVEWLFAGRPLHHARPQGEPKRISQLARSIENSSKPIIVSGSGVLWSKAWKELEAVVETTSIPFFPTPQGRGVIPDDHRCSYPAMRSTAFREADLIIFLGTRLNYVVSHGAAPRFNPEATTARIDIDPEDLAVSPRSIDIPVMGDCKMVLLQLLEAISLPKLQNRFERWNKYLSEGESLKRSMSINNQDRSGRDIHPARLCQEIRNCVDRDAILCVDGQEILNFGRQVMPTFVPGHRLNSGPFGTMGVGLPYGIGAKIAKPDCQVVVVHGDGSFGLNAMELDTAVRHKCPILVVISLNGGWAADPDRTEPGRELGYTRYDKVAKALGCYAEYVEEEEEIRGALLRAIGKVKEGMVAVVNVKTDFGAMYSGIPFTNYAV